jgi:aminopeptidase N
MQQTNRPFLIIKLLTLLLMGGCANEQEEILAVETGVSLSLAEYRLQHISDIHYELEFSIPKDSSRDIRASAAISFKLDKLSQDIQLDFKEDKSKLIALTVNNSQASIVHKNEHLVIPHTTLVKGLNKIQIEFIAGNSSLNRNPEYLYTLFVPDRARTAFPLFDQPNLKATYDLTLHTPLSWQALANSDLKSKTKNDDTLTYAFNTSDKISSYVFSFIAGEFESVSRTVNGRQMTMLHRETDEKKVARNLDTIFELHSASLDWLEQYTGIEYPFKKFDFALIPAFQYGGMEHVGAIQYRASTLFLDENPSDTQRLNRANLIAHESAHMWFGNMVTMDWFNDVWTKEVYANFMAAKIVNPYFPNINHELNFLVRSYPAAYNVDRTEGANPIRQHLPNLNEAGTLYGGIIYNKAPIMMQQLELLLGSEAFQKGIREYLTKFAGTNATWPDLIAIFDKHSKEDIQAWSDVWVNTSGRPEFQFSHDDNQQKLAQYDPAQKHRHWPQRFSVASTQTPQAPHEIIFNNKAIEVTKPNELLVNIDGKGYGLFPTSLKQMKNLWQDLTDLQRGALLINAYEQMLSNHPDISPLEYLEFIRQNLIEEKNQLLLNLMLGQARNTFWSLLTEKQRNAMAPLLELTLIQSINSDNQDQTKQKIFFTTFQSIALTPKSVDYLYSIWEKPEKVTYSLSERDLTDLASIMAIKLPELADIITQKQRQRITNQDRKRRFEFILPSLSADHEVRDAFFSSLEQKENRAVESWVLAALRNLHHPLRHQTSEKYLRPSLELLEEIQRTGDIFFPARWTAATLSRYQTPSAAETVRRFLEQRPDYNYQLKLKVLQAADPIFRANKVLGN